MGVTVSMFATLSMVWMSLQVKLWLAMSPAPISRLPGMIIMLLGPNMSSCSPIRSLRPWVRLMSPVTAMQPMRIPIRFRANRNLRSRSPWLEIKKMSENFTGVSSSYPKSLLSQPNIPPLSCPVLDSGLVPCPTVTVYSRVFSWTLFR